MNDESNPTPREQLEARITAMLLGEAGDFERAELEKAMEADPRLKSFHDEMKRTLGSVEEALKLDGSEGSEDALRLSGSRRKTLDVLFKQPVGRTVAFPEKPRSNYRRHQILAVAAVLALLVAAAGIIIPGMESARFNPDMAQSQSPSASSRDLEALGQTEPKEEMVFLERYGMLDQPLPSTKPDDSAVSFSVQAPPVRQQKIYLPKKESVSQQERDREFTDLYAGQRFDVEEARDTDVLALGRTSQLGIQDLKEEPALRQQWAMEESAPRGGFGGGGGIRFKSAENVSGTGGSEVNVRGIEQSAPTQIVAGDTVEDDGINRFYFSRQDGVQAEQLGAAIEGARAIPRRSLAIPAPEPARRPQSVPVSEPSSGPSAGTRIASRAASRQAGRAVLSQEERGQTQVGYAVELDADQLETALGEPLPQQSQMEAGDQLNRLYQQERLNEFGAVLQDEVATEDLNLAVDFSAPVVQESRGIQEALAKKVAEVEEDLAIRELAELGEAAGQTASTPVELQSSLEPRPEVVTTDNAFSTFSLNVADVSFKLAQASLDNNQLPDGSQLRSEEFLNAFDYHDPAPLPGQRVALNWERARNPFAHDRDLLRFSVQTAARGREPGRPLNLVLLLDNSGSMERADRTAIIREMMVVLADQLQPQDRISVVAFARTPRLWIDGLSGSQSDQLVTRVVNLNPQGGTNLEAALQLAYETARKHYRVNGNNRVILLTDGAANLGNVDPESLRERVVEQRKGGIALDCFGIGWEGYNDALLEQLSRNGDGRYGFINDPAEAQGEFARQLTGALQVAAADVKAQVEFNPARVTRWRQIGYLQHQLTKEQFRDNTVDAAEIGAAESGNALYSIQVNPNGTGPLGTVRVRYRIPSTGQYEETEWVLHYLPDVPSLANASPAMRLAAVSTAFAEWLAQSPHAQEVTLNELQQLIQGVPETFAPDTRPRELARMLQQARSLSGQ